MMKHMSGGLAKLFATMLLGILIVSFAIFGTGPGILSSSSTHVAVVGDIKITPSTFAAAVQNRASQIQQQANLGMDVQTLVRSFNLDYQILEQLIAEATLAAHAQDMGLDAGEAAIAETIKDIEAFNLPGVGFSRTALLQTLQSNGISEQQFFKDVRHNIMSNHITSTLSAAAPVPLFMAEELYRIEAERREATIMNFGVEDVTIGETPNDEALAEFYEPRKESFKSAERRSYQYILIKPELYYDRIELTEDDLRLTYEANEAEFVTPEQREITQVSTNDLATAEAILVAVAGGTDFEDAAVANTNFTKEELALGFRTRASIAADLGDAAADSVFALEENSVSSPIENDLGGYNLFMVTGITEGNERTFEEARERLEFLAREQRAIDLMYEELPDIDDAIFDGEPLGDVASRFNLSLATNTLIDRNGTNISDLKVIESPEANRILSTAFRSQVGDEIQRTDIDASNSDRGGFYIELLDIAEPALQDIANVRGRVIDLWELEEGKRLAGELADKGREMLEAGLSADTIVQDIGGTSFKANNIPRTNDNPAQSQIAPNLRRLIFDLPVGGIDIEQSSTGYAVVKVDAVRPGAPDLATANVEQKLQALSQDWLNEVFIQYQAYLATRYPADRNRLLVDQLFRNPPAQQAGL